LIEDFLGEIIAEQKDFDSKVFFRLQKRYPSQMGKLFGKAEAMEAEISEIKQELKPYFQWWRNKEIDHNKIILDEQQKQRLIEEAIDLQKFLLSFLIELGIDTEEKFYIEYMKKHKIIHQRLKDEN
jgi:hypothetical protein